MRLIVAALALLLLAEQWSLWFGKGGWLRVRDLQRQVTLQRDANAVATRRNDALATEVQSLRAGREAIEERARYELHMMRSDELFFQFVAPADPAKP
ncbi:MAG TPA: cell division protein FtsB [Burkholderiaceae bacterium]|nr:cell division protein FtsB [Burkholderiaceae bacterium]